MEQAKARATGGAIRLPLVFDLKFLAFASMLADHVGYMIGPGHASAWALRLIGRFAFPLFAFLAGYGAVYTRNRQKYMLRLLGFAILSQYPYSLFFTNGQGCNVLFTLLAGVAVFDLIQQRHITLALIVYISAAYFKMDYGIIGVTLVIIFAYFSHFIRFDLPRSRAMESKYWYLFYPGHLSCLFILQKILNI